MLFRGYVALRFPTRDINSPAAAGVNCHEEGISRAISRYAHMPMAVCISVFSAVKNPAHTAEIRRNGSPRGSVAGNGPGFPAHAQAARGLNRSPLASTDVAVRAFWPPIQIPGGCCMGFGGLINL